MNIPGIPVDAWNKAAGQSSDTYLRVGPEQSIGGGGNLPQGRIPDRAPETVWQHPFTILPYWDSKFVLTNEEQETLKRPKGAWCLKVSPGFINGHAPAISVPTNLVPDGVKVWGNKYGKQDRKHARLANFTQVLLTDEWTPFMKVNGFMDARGAVFGATPALPINVPKFFRGLRAMDKPKTDPLDAFFSMATAGGLGYGPVPTAGEKFALDILGGGAGPVFVNHKDDDGFPEGDRYLHFCDVVLEIDRPATRQIFQYDEFGLLRYAGFQIDPPDSGLYNARIYNISVYLIPNPPTLEDIWFGTYIEPKIDEIVLARVFWLSPSKPMLDPDQPIIPDGSWMPFVRHNVFWNMSYAALNIYDPFKPNRDLDFFKQISAVLAGGAAYLIIASQADMIEAQHDQISTFMNNTRVRTRFWTS